MVLVMCLKDEGSLEVALPGRGEYMTNLGEGFALGNEL